MGVDTMIALIERDALDEADALIRDAQATAARLVSEAEERAARRIAEALDRARPALRGEATRRVNAARLRHLERRAALLSSQVARVFDAADREIAGIVEGSDPVRWSAAVHDLAGQALAGVRAARVSVRGADLEGVRGLVTASGGELEPLPDDAPAGVRVRSGDGRLEIDATIPVRLGRARRQLADAVVDALGIRPGVAR